MGEFAQRARGPGVDLKMGRERGRCRGGEFIESVMTGLEGKVASVG